MQRKNGVLAVAVALAWGGSAMADAPVAARQLCNVTGIVETVLQEEIPAGGTSAQGARVIVPVIGLEVASIAPVDANTPTTFCEQSVPAAAQGSKAKAYYRLCDAKAEFMSGQTISGVVGLSKSGGRYCLASISVQK